MNQDDIRRAGEADRQSGDGNSGKGSRQKAGRLGAIGRIWSRIGRGGRFLSILIVIGLAWSGYLPKTVANAFSDNKENANLNAPWPRLSDGRVIITFRNIQLAFPTTRVDLQSFYFNNSDFISASGGYRLISIIDNPQRFRKLFASWPGLLILHAHPKARSLGDHNRMSVEQRTSPQIIASGSYSLLISDIARKQCEEQHSGYVFVYKNIVKNKHPPPFDRTAFTGCYENNVLVTYSSLYRRNWDYKSIEKYQDRIESLFNSIVLNYKFKRYNYDLRDK